MPVAEVQFDEEGGFGVADLISDYLDPEAVLLIKDAQVTNPPSEPLEARPDRKSLAAKQRAVKARTEKLRKEREGKIDGRTRAARMERRTVQPAFEAEWATIRVPVAVLDKLLTTQPIDEKIKMVERYLLSFA